MEEIIVNGETYVPKPKNDLDLDVDYSFKDPFCIFHVMAMLFSFVLFISLGSYFIGSTRQNIPLSILSLGAVVFVMCMMSVNFDVQEGLLNYHERLMLLERELEKEKRKSDGKHGKSRSGAKESEA